MSETFTTQESNTTVIRHARYTDVSSLLLLRSVLLCTLIGFGFAAPTFAQHSVSLGWTQQAQIGAPPAVVASTCVYKDGVKILPCLPSTPLTYTDTAVNAGETHSYALTNVGTSNLESALSTSVTATIPGTVIPPPNPSPTVSLWPITTVPGNVTGNDNASVELGTKITFSLAGQVVGMRFYKVSNSTGVHTGTLWSSTGAKLDTGTFTGETASGWQSITFATPVTVVPNVTYTISYHTTQYAWTTSYFSAARSVPPISAPINAGVYAYGATSAFPTQTYQGSSYFADVLFIPGTALPTITISPTNASLVTGASVQFTAQTTNTTSPVVWSANAPNGLYTAPTTLPSPPSAIVTATAGAVSASATVTLMNPPPPPLTISCTAAVVGVSNLPKGTYSMSVTSGSATDTCTGTN